MLLSDGWDIWKVPAAAGTGSEPDGERQEGRRSATGACCGSIPTRRAGTSRCRATSTMFGEFTKKGGVGRLEPGKPGVQPLLWDDATFGVQKAKKADVYLYTKATPSAPADYYLTDAVAEGREEADGARRAGEGVHVVERRADRRLHRDARQGRRRRRSCRASLFLPANYEKGKSYPTLVYIYEKLTQGHYAFSTPSAPTASTRRSTRATATRC